MATTTASVPCDNSTLANFQAWVSALWGAFVTLGWVQTGDTGQSANPPTAVPSNAYVYQIFKANDSLAGTTPIYVKVECGFNGTGVEIRLTVGTGSNGSGTITGPVIGPHAILGNFANQGSTNYNCYFSGDAGSFRAMLWQTSSVVCTVLGIERSLDTTGTPTSASVTALAVNAVNTSQWFQQSFLGTATGPAPKGGTPNCSNSGATTGNYSANGETAALPVIPLLGFPGNQMLGFVGAIAGDVTESNGTVVTVTIYGANHSYLFTKQNNFLNVARQAVNSVSGSLGMLYE